MEDSELKELLIEIDDKFEELIPLLHKAGKALVDKAQKEKGVELRYSIGWEETGINFLCLAEGKKNFKSFDEGVDWLCSSVQPLFDELRYLHFDAPFALDNRL